LHVGVILEDPPPVGMLDLGGGGTSSSSAEIRWFPLEVRSLPGGERTSGAGGGGAADEGRSAAGAAITAALAARLSA
jgi:hypothetical protein